MCLVNGQMPEASVRIAAAVVNSKAGPKNGKLYTEEDWNTESSVADEPYRYSKVRCVLLCHDLQGVM